MAAAGLSHHFPLSPGIVDKSQRSHGQLDSLSVDMKVTTGGFDIGPRSLAGIRSLWSRIGFPLPPRPADLAAHSVGW